MRDRSRQREFALLALLVLAPLSAAQTPSARCRGRPMASRPLEGIFNFSFITRHSNAPTRSRANHVER